jgi:hypothetical protein
MTRFASESVHTAPRAAVLLPVAYLLHFVEEWIGDLPVWSGNVFANEIPFDRFVAINVVAFPIFIIGTIASLRSPRMAWFAVALAAVFGLNAILHTLGTIMTFDYSPGTITGLALYIPLSTIVLRSAAVSLPHDEFTRAVMAGVLIHVVVSVIAFL